MSFFTYMLTEESGQASSEYVLVIAFGVILSVGVLISTRNALAYGVYQIILDAIDGVVSNIP